MTNDEPTPLMRALDLARIVIERRSTIPLLAHVLLSSDGDGFLDIIGTDLDVEISVRVPFEGDRIRAAVEIETLRRAVDYLGGEATLKHVQAAEKLSVGSVFTLSSLDPFEYPRIVKEIDGASFRLPGDLLLADLKACRPAMSTEEARYYLNGVYLRATTATEDVDAKLCFAATDGHRLVEVVRPLPVTTARFPGLILPRKLVRLLIAVLEQRDAAEVGFVLADHGLGGRAAITIGDVTIKAKMIERTFPDYVRVIPSEPAGHWRVEADAFRQAAKAVAALLGGDSDRRVRHCKLSFRDMTISASSSERGTVLVPMPGTVEGKVPDAIGLNATYCLDLLEPFAGSMRIGFGDPASPVLYEIDPPGALRAVQMPMRL